MKNKTIYNPKHKMGTTIFYTKFGSDIKKVKIVRIVFTQYKKHLNYLYCCDFKYGVMGFGEIGDGFYLTRKEAKKAKSEYTRNYKIRDFKDIEKRYIEAKKKYASFLKKGLKVKK